MTCTTIFQNDNFELYTDKNNKFWLWDKKDETNAAIRAKSELEAYRSAVDMLIFSREMVKNSRDELYKKISLVEECFEKIFPEYEY